MQSDQYTLSLSVCKKDDRAVIYREAADPSLVVFHEKYYMFPSMTKGYFVSEDMVNWQVKKLQGLPVYDYAPDVRVMGEYLYFSASRRDANCVIFTGQKIRNQVSLKK